MGLQEYIKEPSGDGFRYRMPQTCRGFHVLPFAGMWKASNGVHVVIQSSPDLAAMAYVSALPCFTQFQVAA